MTVGGKTGYLNLQANLPVHIRAHSVFAIQYKQVRVIRQGLMSVGEVTDGTTTMR